MSETKRYYWLKLDENFFDDDTIMFIEEQENGILYSNFYLKLCLKSIKNNGSLFRLVGETIIPYDDKALAKITRTDIDTVRVAMSLFERIGLVKKMSTGEIHMSQIQEMIGTETNKAQAMRASRARKKLEGNNVTQLLPKRLPDIELDIELEKDKEIEIKKPKKQKQPFGPPTLEEIKSFCQERSNNVDAEKFYYYYHPSWNVKGFPMKSWKATVITWERNDKKYAPSTPIDDKYSL